MQSRLAGQAVRVFGLRRRISGVSLGHLIGGEIPGQQCFYLLNCGDVGLFAQQHAQITLRVVTVGACRFDQAEDAPAGFGTGGRIGE